MTGAPTWRLAAALATALATTLAPAAAPEDQSLYDRGRSAVFEERWTDARAALEDFTRRFPGSPLADDAYYWLGMALYEQGDPGRAYSVLKQMGSLYPSSPWGNDARALRVRCAVEALKSEPTRTGGGLQTAGRTEYEAFLERSTRDIDARVQLLAIDTMVRARPERAPDLLSRLGATGAPREAAELVLDRFFGGERVKVSLADPALGMQEGNVTIMVRHGDRALRLGLEQAVRAVRSAGGPPALDPAVRSEIEQKLLQTERALVREGDPGSLEAPAVGGSDRESAIVKVVDGEMHYYRNGRETVKILVLKREAGFSADNVKIFLEKGAGTRVLALEEAQSLPPDGKQVGLSEATVRYLKAALAIIEIDLTRAAGVK